MKRGISCESFVRFEKNYAQKISRVLAFFIAAGKEFFQINDGTRKRRAVEPLGSLGWTRFIQGGFARAKIARMASGSPRAIASRRGRQSSGAGRLSHGHAPRGKRSGWGARLYFVKTRLPVDPPSSLRSAADQIGFGKPSGGLRPKGALGLGSGAIRGGTRGAAGRVG